MEQTEAPQVSKSKNIQVRVTQEQYDSISYMSDNLGLSISSFILYSTMFMYHKLSNELLSQPVEEVQQEETPNHEEQTN